MTIQKGSEIANKIHLILKESRTFVYWKEGIAWAKARIDEELNDKFVLSESEWNITETTKKKFEEWKKFITELFLDYGLSIVESDRLFENEETFTQAFKDVLNKAIEEAKKK